MGSTGGISGEVVWLDGDFVPWDAANVPILTHTLHYGLGVFEGLRCYRTDDERSVVFRLTEHVDRLYDSAHINLMEIPFDRADVEAAILETLRRNGLREGYIRPLAFIGDGEMGLNPGDNAIRVAVIVWPWGRYLGEEGLERGIRAKVSTFSRHSVNSKLTKGKTCGDYVNSILAKREALLDGYDEAILLDTHGFVSEASGENVFLVRDSELYTPPLPTVLGGITRASVIELARDRGIVVRECAFARDELYLADELFLTGTAAEVTPVREVDHRRIGTGTRGSITKTLQTAFFDVVTGRDRKHERWLTSV
ncbi:MAG: branched-chain amino acid transaminase [Myxococcota bacterium]|nr:branched chain amino acid aminotransferase [Deltaproteobacteria bacterium]MCP4239712.1 branched-chain amino acid transaminase [bacterium]MDP7073816.1 branched-chain amino acid transaminase [Myxococcota bacterium]MDP7300328.1 branched-chain amino acid transaminase [Myxococcota bacterium]MDP7433391.1 branched-chain amino acid transaminase [Myxococcota bacterium]